MRQVKSIFFILQLYIYQHEKLQNFITLKVTQRYEKLIKDRPQYVQRVSNKIVASHLDI
jgi:hypothetical protein